MYRKRIELYKKLEEKRGNPLIVYVTSIRNGIEAQMGADAVSEIIKQINMIPNEAREIDFLIISNGGDPICSLRICNILRERFEKVHVLVPYVAYSAATLLALGANDIIMHPFSNLGPVDPQMTQIQQLPNGQTIKKAFAAGDLINYFKFVKEDVGITDQTALSDAFHVLTASLEPTAIGAAKRSNQLSIALSEKLLSYHMTDVNKATTISKSLMTSFYHHGYAVSRSEAKKIGLTIIEPTSEIESLMWDIWQDFEKEMQAGKPFVPQNELNDLKDYKEFLARNELQQKTFIIKIYIASIESVRAISINENEIDFVCQKTNNVTNPVAVIPNQHIHGWVYKPN